MTINFVLCNASLELYRNRSAKRRSLPISFSLLNEEDHYREVENNRVPKEPAEEKHGPEGDEEDENVARAAKFKRRNWKEVRPDILHFCLLALHDSILNKEQRIAIWVHTLNSQLYRVYPEFRIPRTFKVFNKVMAKYLHSNARCLKPEGDDSTILVERVNKRLEDLGDSGIKVAVSIQGKLERPESFFQDSLAGENPDDIWIYLSLSNHSPLAVTDQSGIICVSDIHQKLVERSDRTPASSTYSQELERKLINGDTEKENPVAAFDHHISVSRCYPTAMSTCYKLVCALERILGL